MIRVSAHGVGRYRERVADIPNAAIRQALDIPIVHTAIEFGAHCVRLGTGQRVIIEDGAVITILPAEHYRRQVQREGLGRFGHTDRAHRRGIRLTIDGGARE